MAPAPTPVSTPNPNHLWFGLGVVAAAGARLLATPSDGAALQTVWCWLGAVITLALLARWKGSEAPRQTPILPARLALRRVPRSHYPFVDARGVMGLRPLAQDSGGVLLDVDSAFAPGHAPTERTPATRRSACAVHMKTRGPDHVGRRAVLALAALPALGLRRASAAAPSEAAELQRLRDEAARIQEIFDVQKELNSNMPSLKDGLKAAKGAGADVEQTRVARAADSVPGTTVDMQTSWQSSTP